MEIKYFLAFSAIKLAMSSRRKAPTLSKRTNIIKEGENADGNVFFFLHFHLVL